jgi:hypothetical protein
MSVSAGGVTFRRIPLIAACYPIKSMNPIHRALTGNSWLHVT